MEFDDFMYFSGYYNVEGNIIKVVTTCSTQMGMAASATMTTKIIHSFCPRYVVMTGIAAGVKGKTNMGMQWLQSTLGIMGLVKTY